MGLQGLSPQELAADMCRSLPAELNWLHEEKFINFIASNSERSLAVLLGSGRQGSITRQKMENASLRHEHYVAAPGLSGTNWYGARAFASENRAADAVTRQPGKLIAVSDSCEAMRILANSREASAALERAVMDFEQQWQDGQLQQEYAENWLTQLVAQAGSLQEGLSIIDPSNFGLVCEPIKGLKRDVKRNLKQLVEYVRVLSDQFGLAISTAPDQDCPLELGQESTT